MSFSKRWIAFGLVSSSLLVGAAALYGERMLPPYWFVPLAGAGVVGAFFIGSRRVSSPSLRRRLVAGGLATVAWAAFLVLPWLVRSGLFLWSAHSLPAPPGASYLIAPGDDIDYGPFEKSGWPHGGYQVLWQSDLTADKVERFYRDRLSGRGWRFLRRHDVATPTNGGVGRTLLFRRADGFLTLNIATATGKGANFGLVYDHFAAEWRYD